MSFILKYWWRSVAKGVAGLACVLGAGVMLLLPWFVEALDPAIMTYAAIGLLMSGGVLLMMASRPPADSAR